MHLLIVDDDFGSRAGMVQTLQAYYPAAALYQARSVREAQEQLSRQPAMDLVLLDLNLDDSRGLTTLRTLKLWCEERDCNPRIVVLSAVADYDDSVIPDAIENCATGFIAKGTAEEVFRSAIELTLAGSIYIPQRYLNSRRPAAASKAAPADEIALTARERDVAALLLKGLSYKQIAKALAVPGHPMSDNTVRVHVQRMAWKLRVSDDGQSNGLTAKAAVLTAFAQRGIRFPPAA